MTSSDPAGRSVPRVIRAILAATTTAVCAGSPAIASADAAEQGMELDEVVVTAQKRTENIQDVPISITAFAGEYLERLNAERVADVMDFAPNVSRSSGPTGGADGFFFIRGVGQVDNSATVDPGVGVYVDDVYLGRIQGASLDLVDVERVEVLRGPQGTLFGRNTIGGAINVVTADPGDEFSARVRLGVGNRERRDALASINLPLGETTGANLSAFTRNQAGWSESVYTGADYGRMEDAGGRARLVWKPSEDFTARFTVDATSRDGSPASNSLLGFNPRAACTVPGTRPPTSIPGTTPTCVPFPAPAAPPGQTAASDLLRDANTERPVSYNSVPDDLDEQSRGAAVQLTWELDAFTIKSITSYRTLEQLSYADLDGTGYQLYDASFLVDQDQFAQEFQFSGSAFSDRLDWTLGLYAFEEDIDNDTRICVGTNRPATLPNGQPVTLPPAFPGGPPRVAPGPATRNDGRCIAFGNQIDLSIESLAAFANARWALGDRWTATVGMRWTEDTKDQAFNSFTDNRAGVATLTGIPPLGAVAGAVGPGVAPPPGLPPVPFRYEESWSEVTPRLGLDYRPSDDLLLYASYSRGFKSGGFGARATPLAPIRPYDPELVDNYEVGLKSEFFDRRVRLNAAVFFAQYENIQLLILDPLTAQFETRNGGDNEMQGIELELRARPIDGLDVTVAAGWLENEYTRFAGVAQIDPGDKLPNAPEYTLDVGAEYRWKIGENLLGLRADWNYRAEHWFQALNNPLDRQGGFGLVNARATLELPGSNMTVALFGLNLTDKLYYLTRNDTRTDLGVATGIIAPGREYGLEFSVRF
ncbi:MAG: TonB-dependent receptor [Steroidobacteraceae bacterium]|jgi:iron complex outermembrane receptor protein|nr:TonB-dependent receptor [Steroidobacteraceae bacterium]